ncbi:MAG TPA: mechanosensitive ion channel family protein [Phycisphaerales bacterium]|nr:mechanosensitive ion channel family protein [Phycisphaerales bacterium]
MPQDAAETQIVAETPVDPTHILAARADSVWTAWTDGRMNADDFLVPWTTFGWPLVQALLLVVVVLLLARWARQFVTRAALRARVETTLARFFGNIARWVILVLGAVTILQTFGVEATSFAAAIAAVGFAIGMALSGTLGNLAAGIMLLISRPFRVGDTVSAAGVAGVVDEIGLFTTTFDTVDKRRIIVPNGKIFGDIIENVTFHKVRRIEVPVGTAYGADVDATRAVLERAVRSVQGAEHDPPPQVVLSGLGASSVDWKLQVWARNAVYGDVQQRLIRDAKLALDQAGIGIPFPQRDVHVPAGITVRVEKAGLES